MTLSDELVKTDQIVEGIVRKIEKAAMELSDRSKADLSVGGVPAPRYIQQFAWDSAKYPNRRPLKDLVSLITSGAVAVEAELKQLTQSYGDKQASLQEAQRKKGGNLMVADLNDTLTDDIMARVEVHDTEYLKTCFVAIAKSMKENFESTIYNIGSDLVGYGGPDWSRDPSKLGQAVNYGAKVDRHKVKGSPVVPGSLKQIFADKDSILYTVTILKSQYEAGYYENDEFQQGNKIDFEPEFVKACKDKRFVVRTDFTWDPTKASRSENMLEQLQVEVDGMKSALMRWCKTHYGDAYVAWMHIKVIRVFVESVLRYGLPVDFTAVLYKVQGNKEPELIKALDKSLGTDSTMDDDDDNMEGDEYHDFVLIKFEA